MRNFLAHNKKQLVLVLLFNLISLIVVLFITGRYAIYINDDELVFMSIIFGLLVTRFTIVLLKANKKEYAIRIILGVVAMVALMTFISGLIIDPEEVLLIPAMILGFIIYMYADNVFQTVKNIKEKSKLVLKDLDKK